MYVCIYECVLEGVLEYKEVSARITWVKVKFGRENWDFVSAYGPISVRNNGYYSVMYGLVDVHEARGAGGGVSDLFLVVSKVKGGW